MTEGALACHIIVLSEAAFRPEKEEKSFLLGLIAPGFFSFFSASAPVSHLSC